jgi:hypothetical protein
MQNIKPIWIFLAIAIIMLLFMKNENGETFVDSITDTLKVFTDNPMLLVIIGVVVFLFLQKDKDGQKAIAG